MRRDGQYERGSFWAVEPAAAGAGPGGVEEAGSGDAAELAAAMGLHDPAEVRRRLARGARAFVARVEGRVAAYGWVSVGAECIGELEREISLPPGEAYVWNCATLPEFRRRGLYTAILRHAVAVLGREGCRRIWIGAALSNHPSVRGFVAAGFRPVLRIVYVRLGAVSCLVTAPFRGAPPELVEGIRRVVAAPGESRRGPLFVGRGRAAPARCA